MTELKRATLELTDGRTLTITPNSRLALSIGSGMHMQDRVPATPEDAKKWATHSQAQRQRWKQLDEMTGAGVDREVIQKLYEEPFPEKDWKEMNRMNTDTIHGVQFIPLHDAIAFMTVTGSFFEAICESDMLCAGK